MRRIALWLGGVAFISALVALALSPGSTNADTFQFSGLGADAGFFFVDEGDPATPNDDVFTSAGVFSGNFDNRFHDPPGGPPDSFTNTFADIFISQFIPGNPEDPADDIFRNIFGHASPVSLTVDRRLTSATLDATADAFICEFVGGPPPPPEPGKGGGPPPGDCTPTTLTVHLDWTGFGNLSHSGGSFHFREPGFRVNSHFSGTSRDAEVTGSITDSAGTDYTGGTTGFGHIFNARSGDIIID